MNLIVVESPTKARTFNRLLKGKDYYVFATMGHIRDLPGDKIAIDYGKNFKPEYKIIDRRKKTVDELKKLAKTNKNIILATDLDREGESIAYHIAYITGHIKENWPDFSIKPGSGLKRIVFHEITEHALKEALGNPTELRFNLVKSQQTRRILDRIVGYELSPLLWKKTGKNWLSAGRVQTVALRLIVEREKEIKNFKQEKYFQLFGHFKNGTELIAKLVSKDDIPFEQSFKLTLFAGEYQYTKTTIDEKNLDHIKSELNADSFFISEIKESVVKRYPPPPFTTSLLQQDGYNRFGFSSKMVMKLAQDLYEHGLISYHRTDSFNLSTQFVFRAKDYIEKIYGKKYSLDKPRGFRTKSRMAQEAHEAIRPTNLGKTPESIKTGKNITINHRRLYQLIFIRAVATQMKEAEIKQIKVLIVSDKNYLFQSDFQQVLFDGFLKILNPEFVSRNQSSVMVKTEEILKLENLEQKDSLTQPPPRYNEASLIKIMEEKGIGRPSTYAPIISLIQDKGYVEKEVRQFIPTVLGSSICDYLSSSFPEIFGINFTVSMEDGLDEIAAGNKDIITLLSDFYRPFKTQLESKKNDREIIHIEEESLDPCPKCAKKLTIRYSRFGKFYACTGYPKCRFTKPFLKFVPGKTCPQCGGKIVIKYTKSKKRFYGCENYPKCHYSSWKLLP